MGDRFLITDSQSWKFILDSSALIEMLARERSDDQTTGRRRLQPGKLTQLARTGAVWVTSAVADEVLEKSDIIADWVKDNRSLTQPPITPDPTQQHPFVYERTNHLPDFQNSVADMEGLCTALAFNRLDTSQAKAAIVVRDDQYEAACFVLGVTVLSPAAFVLMVASQPLP